MCYNNSVNEKAAQLPIDVFALIDYTDICTAMKTERLDFKIQGGFS
ncbi:hypothetical protein CHK_1898 [Christensenella hongkongensis]|uniref:Uncharacterized protein n=1 Tax=Christensenella hongkongensis TaxID=270498 RepID=A0A0M2NDK3_9FIRM|nr:hypothetical protein CHK_1898 [Christensenella hongkongensis]